MEGTREEEVGEAEKLMQIGLGVPEVTRLVARLREGGMPLSPEIYTVDAAKEALLALLGGDRA